MSRSLYGMYDEPSSLGWTFSIQSYNPEKWSRYMSMKKKVGLKNDFGWREVQHLQNVLRKADIWDDFPARGYTLVNAEFKGGDEDQRIDLLYLRNDGALLPCELKIGGDAKDSHGQLIRYIADLFYQKLDLGWIQKSHSSFLSTIQDDTAREIHRQKLETFIAENAIEDKFIRLLPQTGVLIDESFPSQMLKAVRYFNGYCGFSIRMLQVEAFVEDDWVESSKDFLYRIDFIDIQ